MDKDKEQMVSRLIERAGLELAAKDRERFVPMLDAYLNSIERLHDLNLGGEELGPVFDPDSAE